MAELAALVNLINRRLSGDDKVKDLLPLKDGDDFFGKIKSGTLLVKFIELFIPSVQESSKMNVGNLNKWQSQANVRTAAGAFKVAKCRNVVKEGDIMDSIREPILKAMWECVELNMIDGFMKRANKNIPHFEKLFKEGESMFKLNKQGPAEILKRWINYQLGWMEKEEWYIQEDDLGRVEKIQDLNDGFFMYWFVRQTTRNTICKKEMEEEIKGEAEALGRITMVYEELKKLDPILVDWVTPQDILDGNEKLMTWWLIEVFKKHSALDDITYFDKHYLTDIQDYSNLGKPGEESQIKMWMISLGYSPDFTTLKDGLIILKLLDSIKKGCVDWKTVAVKPRHKFDMVANCDKAIEISKKMLGLKLIGISGSNLHSADAGMITKFMSGVFKAHQEFVLLKAGGGDLKIGENFLVQWANSRIEEVEDIASLRDPKLADGKFLFDLIQNIYPRYVDPKKLSDDPVSNLNVVFTVCVKLTGIALFVTPKDVQDSNYKLLNPTFAAMYLKDVQLNPWLYNESYKYQRGN